MTTPSADDAQIAAVVQADKTLCVKHGFPVEKFCKEHLVFVCKNCLIHRRHKIVDIEEASSYLKIAEKDREQCVRHAIVAQQQDLTENTMKMIEECKQRRDNDRKASKQFIHFTTIRQRKKI